MQRSRAADIDLDAVECSVPRRPLVLFGDPFPQVEWEQNSEQVKLVVTKAPEAEFKIEFGIWRLKISAMSSGRTLLSGRLPYEVDPDASYWDVNATGTKLQVVLVKKLKREWLTLFVKAPVPAANGPADNAQAVPRLPPRPANEVNQPSSAPTAMSKINELRKRLRAKVSALEHGDSKSQAQGQTQRKIKSPSKTKQAAPAPASKPPQRIDESAAKAAEAASKKNSTSLRGKKWEEFDEAAAIAEIENEGKPVVCSCLQCPALKQKCLCHMFLYCTD